MAGRSVYLVAAVVCLLAAAAAPGTSAGEARERLACANPTPDLEPLQIYSIRDDGKRRRLVSRGPGFPGGSVVLSHDGTRALFECDGLWVARVDGTRARRLAPRSIRPDFGGAGPSFSLGGRRVAFTGYRVRCDRCTPVVYTVDIDGHGFRAIGSGTKPSFAPDGRRLVYQSTVNFAIVVVDRTGRKHQIASGSEPVWAPRGERLAYRGGQYGGLCLVNADASGRRCVFPGTSGTNGIVWSPDAKQVVYPSLHGLRVVGSDGRGLRLLTTRSSPEDVALAWSPNSRRIANLHSTFIPGRVPPQNTTQSQIYVRNVRGAATVRRVTSEPLDTQIGTSISWRNGRITYSARSLAAS